MFGFMALGSRARNAFEGFVATSCRSRFGVSIL
jgi:hypothetical protein